MQRRVSQRELSAIQRPLPGLQTSELADLLQVIRVRVLSFLQRRGVIQDWDTWLGEHHWEPLAEAVFSRYGLFEGIKVVKAVSMLLTAGLVALLFLLPACFLSHNEPGGSADGAAGGDRTAGTGGSGTGTNAGKGNDTGGLAGGLDSAVAAGGISGSGGGSGSGTGGVGSVAGSGGTGGTALMDGAVSEDAAIVGCAIGGAHVVTETDGGYKIRVADSPDWQCPDQALICHLMIGERCFSSYSYELGNRVYHLSDEEFMHVFDSTPLLGLYDERCPPTTPIFHGCTEFGRLDKSAVLHPQPCANEGENQPHKTEDGYQIVLHPIADSHHNQCYWIVNIESTLFNASYEDSKVIAPLTQQEFEAIEDGAEMRAMCDCMMGHIDPLYPFGCIDKSSVRFLLQRR